MNVEVKSFAGLTVDFAKECNTNAVVRGLRAITDFEYELQIAQLNRVMDTSIDTVFLTTSLEYAYLSSSTVKEVAAYGGDISNFVTPYVADEVHKRLRERQGDLELIFKVSDRAESADNGVRAAFFREVNGKTRKTFYLHVRNVFCDLF